ncbi:PAS domain S-box protein [Salidesulfovibrio onnuriiensis]|uniref:PAS domain S-box protein n=1 Tax=Salidesulfovibrio onnuriiensis TaxID=2583823 RepID=UPI0011C90ED0|nr:PAS domain S-box protein [Salidesulfovibrio onnuriiensis]
MKRSILVVPLALFAIFMLAVFMFERAETEQHRNKMRLNIFYELSAIQSRFETALSRRLNILRATSAVFSGSPNLPDEQADNLIKSLVYDQEGVDAVIVARDNRIVHVYPPTAEDQYLDIPTDHLPPVVSLAIKSSIVRRDMVVMGPSEFFPGRSTILAAIPVFEQQGGPHGNGPFWGAVAMVLDPESIFKDTGLVDEYPELKKALMVPHTDASGWQMAYGSRNVFDADPVTMHILLPQGYWQLAAIPQEGWGKSPYSTFIFGSGFLLALALSLGLWHTLHQARARELAREEYYHLVHTARSIILRLDTAGRIRFINEYALSFFGFERDELEGHPLVGGLFPEFGLDGRNISSLVNRLIRTPSDLPAYEIEAIKKNGEIVWIAWSNRPSYDPRGKLRDIVCVGTDVTKRRQMEEALRKSESKYRLLTENVTDVIWGLDANLHFTYISPSDKQLRGFDAVEVLGKPLWDYVAHGSKDLLLHIVANLERKLHKGQDLPETLTMSLEMLCKDGSTVWVETRATVLYNDEGDMVGMQGVSRDISDRTRADALREDMERIARHDLKTPLGAVIGLPEEIAREGNLTPQQNKMLEVIRKAGTSMLELINRSLDLYKMETDAYALDLERVDLIKLLDLIGAESRPLLRAKGISLGVETPDGAEEFPVMGEKPLLHAMLSNMVKNALEASPEGGSVHIRLRRRDGVRISVRNAGSVPEELREVFFDKYAKGDSSKGSGLGTYSMRLIARTHGGDARLDAATPGETTVNVILPDRPLK